jgi:hypothetical protein
MYLVTENDEPHVASRTNIPERRSVRSDRSTRIVRPDLFESSDDFASAKVNLFS